MTEINTDKISFYKDNNWYSLENKLYYVPYKFFTLTTGATSSDILNAFDGQDGFTDFVNHLKDNDIVYSFEDGASSMVAKTFIVNTSIAVTSTLNVARFTYIHGSSVFAIGISFNSKTFAPISITEKQSKDLFK